MVVGAALRAAGRMMQWYCPVLRRESCEDADRPGFGRRADKCKIVRCWSRWWWPQYQRPRWTASWNATGRAADAWDPKKLCGATGAVGGSSSVAAGQSACKWRVACTVRKFGPSVFFFSLSAEHATHAAGYARDMPRLLVAAVCSSGRSKQDRTAVASSCSCSCRLWIRGPDVQRKLEMAW